MSLIEGIGDEVLHFFIIVILFAVAAIAWWSTRISDRPLIRTVLILERQQPRQVSGQPAPAPTAPPSGEGDKPEDAAVVEEAAAGAAPVEASERPQPAPQANSSTDDTIRPEQISTLRNRRLAFFEEMSEVGASSSVAAHNANLQDLLHAGSQPEPSAPEREPSQDEEIGLLSGTSKDDVSTSENVSTIAGSNQDETVPVNEPPPIRIRLKYLNDDLKLVEGSLEEQLGDFKKRHFSLELAGRKLVRLIFNGQVLGQDNWTLGHYGLYDNCVVHCLVHQPRTPPPSPNLNARPGTVRAVPITSMVLSNVLMATMSLVLVLAWYGRYQYPQLYTATTTVALVGLTGILTVSLIGIYMPDPVHP